MFKNELTDEEKETLVSYDRNAQNWAATHWDQDYWNKETKIFKTYLPSGKVVEIGAGGGRDAKVLINEGYDYIGTDISHGLLEEARKNNPGAKFFEQSVYQLDFPDDTFAGFWASAVLLHIPKDRVNKALQSIWRVVRTEGIGFISIKQGEGEKVIQENRQEGVFKRFWAFYTQDEFNKVLQRNNFQILYSDIHPSDGKTIWLTYIVQVIK